LINSGIYLLDSNIIPDDIKNVKIETDFFPEFVKNKKVKAYFHD
jgi:NDP-sugar pyrophosphorylase family protein